MARLIEGPAAGVTEPSDTLPAAMTDEQIKARIAALEAQIEARRAGTTRRGR